MNPRIEVLWCNHNKADVNQVISVIHHHSCYQMYYILKGRMDFLVLGKTFKAQEGMYLVIPSQMPHSVPFSSADSECYELKILINDAFIASNFEEMQSPIKDTGVIKKLLKYVVKNWTSSNEQNCKDIDYIISTVLMSFFSENLVYKDRKSRYITTNSYPQIITDCILYIERHYPYPFSLEAMAESIHYNSNYISGLFKKTTGYTIIDYLNLLRIKNSIIYFFYYNQDVFSACKCVGYNDISYFSRSFKKLTGISPRKFKKSLLESSPKRKLLASHLESSIMFKVSPISESFKLLSSIKDYC